jgi:hypothetical protein
VRRLFFGLAAVFGLLYSAVIPQVFAAALILAFGIRLAYVLLRWRSRRPLLSGWIFVIALGLLLDVAAGAPGPKTRRANATAVRQGVVAKAVDATPRDRCVGLLLDWWDEEGRTPGRIVLDEAPVPCLRRAYLPPCRGRARPERRRRDRAARPA